MIALLSLLAATPLAVEPIHVELRPSQGLFVSQGGIPVIVGSSFQYYEAGWTRGYYSSGDGGQTVEPLGDGSTRMSFKSHDGRVFGTETVQTKGRKLVVDVSFGWKGEGPALVEANLANLWAPAFRTGSISIDGGSPQIVRHRTYGSASNPEERRLSANSAQFEFTNPNGTARCAASTPLMLFDSVGYSELWSRNNQMWWLGSLGLPVSREHPATVRLEWDLDLRGTPAAEPIMIRPEGKSDAHALSPSEQIPVLVPKPKENGLRFDRKVEVASLSPAGKSRASVREFLEALRERFQLSPAESDRIGAKVSASVRNLRLPPSGYRITIAGGRASVVGQDQDGLGYGLRRMAQLVFVGQERLCLPSGTLTDWPSIRWRGAHLFVGPKAVAFQQKLWKRVLRPLGLNKVLLQCERTDWRSTPGIATAVTMPRSELVRLFAMYRSMGVEPIPLIQSLGHSEWLFENGKNLDIAVDPATPYTMDPKKPRTRELLNKIWDEAIEVLHPTTIHFGLDEIDPLGKPNDPGYITDLWRTHVPFLGEIAKRHHVRGMLWGDKGLAPNEAIDSANGDNPAEAKKRRVAIPKGSYIADWHYKSSVDVPGFERSLKLWRDEGYLPIASSSFSPENIRAFDLAAQHVGAGVLQTIWAGYESNEQAMIAGLPQFSALVLAADYAWSPREELPSKLGYDPVEVLKSMYFDLPSPLVSRAGRRFTFGDSAPLRIGSVELAKSKTPLQLASKILPRDPRTGSDLTILLPVKATRLYAGVATALGIQSGEPVAKIKVQLASGQILEKTLFYGLDVRSLDDPGTCLYSTRREGISAIAFDLGSTQTVVSVKFESLDAVAGLQVHSITVVE